VVKVCHCKLSPALKSAHQKMDLLLQKVKALGIEDRDIQTSLSTRPQQTYEANKPSRIVGYFVSSQAQIKIRNISKAGDVIDASLAAGANSISDIQWVLEDEESHRSKAREKAIKLLFTKMNEMATVAGVKLGKIISLSENSNPGPSFPRGVLFEETAAMSKPVSRVPGTPINAGTIRLNVEIFGTAELLL